MAAHLLTIPLELRLKICSIVIVNDIMANVWSHKMMFRASRDLPDFDFEYQIKRQIGEVRWSLTLLLVNKQLKGDVEQLLLKKNWIHFEGLGFSRFRFTNPNEGVIRFFDDVANLNNAYRVTRISLPMDVLPALLRWYCGEHRNMHSLSEIIFYDGGEVENDDEGNLTYVVGAGIGADVRAARAATLAKAESLAFLGECYGGFLPNELGVVLRFELFVNKTVVRIDEVSYSYMADDTPGICGEAGQG